MSSHLSLIKRRGLNTYRLSRRPIAGKRGISYVLTTPSRRISKHRISLIRHSKSLSKALFQRRARQRAIIRKHPGRISTAKQTMYARERALLMKSRAQSGGYYNLSGGYKLTSPNHRAQISAYQQYRRIKGRRGSVRSGKWALPKRSSRQFQNFLKRHYSRAKKTYRL